MIQIHNLTFKQVYYFPGAPTLLNVPNKWSQDRGEDNVRREGTYLKVMRKRSILVCNNRKTLRIILHDPGFTLSEISMNQGQEGLTKFFRIFYSMFSKISKESDRVHARPAVFTTQQMEDWAHHPLGDVVTEMEERNSDKKDSMMPSLIHPEDSDNQESLSNPHSAEPTTEPRTPNEKYAKGLTSEPNFDALS